MTLFVGATRLVSETRRCLDPQGSKSPEPNDIKLDSGDYVGESSHMQTVLFLPLLGVGLYICMKLLSSVSIYLNLRCFYRASCNAGAV